MFLILLQVINYQTKTGTKNLEAIKSMKKRDFLGQATAAIVELSYIYSTECYALKYKLYFYLIKPKTSTLSKWIVI